MHLFKAHAMTHIFSNFCDYIPTTESKPELRMKHILKLVRKYSCHCVNTTLPHYLDYRVILLYFRRFKMLVPKNFQNLWGLVTFRWANEWYQSNKSIIKNKLNSHSLYN